jgi:hypothetical protein
MPFTVWPPNLETLAATTRNPADMRVFFLSGAYRSPASETLAASAPPLISFVRPNTAKVGQFRDLSAPKGCAHRTGSSLPHPQ